MTDPTVLVTGGTGGLGAAVTQAFLDDGWRVVVPWIAER
jgi:NAD(P)-dependent dehydrogenase (short-subunit alcohol dehydrogenase family)